MNMNKIAIAGLIVSLGLLSTSISTAAGDADSPINRNQIEQRESGLLYAIGSDIPFTGIVTEHYPGGEKMLSIRIEDGEPRLTTGWYPNGQKAAESNLDSNKSGRVSEWYENGQLKIEGELLDGATHGHLTTWYSNGKKRTEEDYRVRGRPQDGFSTEWYDNGQMKSKERWVQGQTRCSVRWDQAGNKDELNSWNWARCMILPKDQIYVAVLPFDVTTEGAEAESVSHNLTQSIISDLVKEGYKVAPRDQAATLKGSPLVCQTPSGSPHIPCEEVIEASKSLHITHLFSGTLAITAGRITLSALVTSSEEGDHIWSEYFARPLTESADIRSSISASVVDALITQ
jgi:antitoxin component YwqK of YwqJK toxin-antitoxin module